MLFRQFHRLLASSMRRILPLSFIQVCAWNCFVVQSARKQKKSNLKQVCHVTIGYLETSAVKCGVNWLSYLKLKQNVSEYFPEAAIFMTSQNASLTVFLRK